MVVKKTKMRIF